MITSFDECHEQNWFCKLPKTWYGTHSKRGAETASIILTLVETCKLNKVNPREYFKDLTENLLSGKEPYTPSEYLKVKIGFLFL